MQTVFSFLKKYGLIFCYLQVLLREQPENPSEFLAARLFSRSLLPEALLQPTLPDFGLQQDPSPRSHYLYRSMSGLPRL